MPTTSFNFHSIRLKSLRERASGEIQRRLKRESWRNKTISISESVSDSGSLFVLRDFETWKLKLRQQKRQLKRALLAAHFVRCWLDLFEKNVHKNKSYWIELNEINKQSQIQKATVPLQVLSDRIRK